MEGGGGYNRASKVQAASVLSIQPWLEQAAAAVTLDAPLYIADYGSSQGLNSLAPMSLLIERLRQRCGAEHPIVVLHVDLPGNDFRCLFDTLEHHEQSYLRTDAATYAFAAGRSFYRSVAPANSVTLGWSAWAVQWLSTAPVDIPDHIHSAFTRSSEIQAVYARQAAQDWQIFLTHRGQELKRSGRLLVMTMARDAQNSFGYERLVDALYRGLLDLVDTGLISQDEVLRMSIPTYGRNREELLAPFSSSGEFAGLSVEQAEIFSGTDWIWEQFEQDGDAQQFGAHWAAFSRASTFPTLAANLRRANDTAWRNQFFDALERAMQARLAIAPEPTNIPLAKLLLVKNR